MSWRTLKNTEKTFQIIDHLIQMKREIKVKIKGDNTEFSSRVIRSNEGGDMSETWEKPVMVIEKLSPEKGSALIQSVKKASLEFPVNSSSIKCSVDYMGISSTPPYFGFIVTIPEYLEIEEKRSNDRYSYETPDFVSAEFTVAKGTPEEKSYELSVMDCSRYGLGLIVDKGNIDILHKIKKGTIIRDMAFYATWAMIKVTGIVQHISKIEEGKYANGYLLGIESRDIIESCRQKETQD